MERLLKKSVVGFLSIFLSAPLFACEAEHVQAIYQHLVDSHWVPETGLFISFLGTEDNKLAQQSSTYEQAAVGILAVRLGDVARAQRIFLFMKQAWVEGPQKSEREGMQGLTNFYNGEFGGEGIEKTIHSGPNAWAGLFAAYYGNQTGDGDAQAWALELARWMAHAVPHQDGGIAMGPRIGYDGIPWTRVYSTENNLSYYAFLSELLHGTRLSPSDKTWISEERGHVEDWLVHVGFDRLAYAMNRGYNPQGLDRTRALDTITWLISAVGPQRLKERGLDPDRLMRQAEESFEVKVHGLDGVDSTDQPEADLTFASAPNELGSYRGSPRTGADQHRIIWYEGLGQYINALNRMAAYAGERGDREKARLYTAKAQHLLEQFDAAALPNHPEGTAYQYATYGKFFLDGWYPPKDAPDGPPSSLIAAVWRCFAGLGLDPLDGQQIASVPRVDVQVPVIAAIHHPSPSILYGASDDMVSRAWEFLNRGDNDRAIQQAQATVQEWSPWARKLEEKKAAELGRLISYEGDPEQRQQIFNYWALNDVAAAYFILGKAFDLQGHYTQAVGALQHIARNYPLAQIWDPRGWFWSPLDSIQDEFVSRNPVRYGHLLPPVVVATSDLSQLPN
jgi:hypothetical protein